MSKYEAVALSVYLGSMFVAIAIVASVQAWSDVRIAQAEAAECVCAGAP